MQEEFRLTQTGSYSKHTDKVWSLQWSAKGDTLITTSCDKQVKVWRLDGEKGLHDDDVIDHEHSKTVRAIAFSANNKLLALASFDTKISIWRVFDDTFEYITSLEGHESEVKHIDWHASKNYLASCSRDKTIWVWEYDTDLDFQCFEVLNGHSQDIKMVKWVPGQDYQLASASYDDTVKLWDYEDDEYFPKQTLSDHTSTVWCICFSKDAKYLISSSEDKSIKVYSRTSSETYVFALNITGHHERVIYSVDYNSEHKLIISAGGDDCICLFQLTEGESNDDCLSYEIMEKKLSAHTADINCVKFHPFLRLAASCCDAGELKLWTF